MSVYYPFINAVWHTDMLKLLNDKTIRLSVFNRIISLFVKAYR
jgi:hypothetical protein